MRTRHLIACVALAPLSSVCLAQIEETGREVTVDLDVGGIISFRSDVDDSEGDVAVYRAASGLRVGIPIAKSGELGLTYGVEYSHYDFENVDRVIQGVRVPFSDIYMQEVIATYRHRFDEAWGVLGGGYVRSFGEHGADFEETLTAGFFAAGTYTFNANLTVGLGFSAEGRLEGDMRVLPRVLVDWRFHDRWRLYNRPSISGTSVALAYEHSDEWTFSLDGAWADREFRLDDDLSIPDAFVSDERFSVGLGAEWTPTPQLSLTGRAGAHLWQEYEVRDAQNNRVTRSRTDPTPAISLELTYRF